MRQQIVECAVLLQQLRRRFDAYAGDPRHVVHRIADQRLQIDDLFRRNSPILSQGFAVELEVFPQIIHAYAVGN
jgi:hypothetical protein